MPIFVEKHKAYLTFFSTNICSFGKMWKKFPYKLERASKCFSVTNIYAINSKKYTLGQFCQIFCLNHLENTLTFEKMTVIKFHNFRKICKNLLR